MPLELRDLATGKKFDVPEAGTTIGRTGSSKAELQLEEPGISNRHARVFAVQDAWFIEDLGSSNGTFVGETRITAPTAIVANDVLTIARTKLLVVGPAFDPKQQQTMLVQPAMSREEAQALLAAAEAAKKPPAADADKTAPVGRPAVAAAAPKGPPRRTAPSKKAESAAEEPEGSAPEPDSGGAQKKGVGYFIVAVPKAIAFYLAAIPLMVVNPIGTIRKGVADPKHEPKQKMELIAYALPVNLFSAAVGFLSTVIVQLVTRTLNIGGLLVGMLIIPAIVAVVASAITGFIWHPVVGWIVTKLKGESDDRSRTNYFLMFMTASALVALPNGIGTLLGLVPFRLVAMVQPALSALGSVVVLFVTYSWMKQFNVVKWFQTVILVLGALTLVGGVFGMLGRLSSAPVGVGVSGSDVAAQVAAAQKQADDAVKAAEKATAEGNAALKEGQAALEKAEGQVVVAKAGAEKPAAAEKPAVAGAAVGYADYVKMRAVVEKAIADDPALLTGNPEVLALYRDYTTATFEVDKKFKALDAKNPADAQMNARLRDAELFEKTAKSVVALNGKVTGTAPKPAPAAKEEKAEAKPAPAAKEEKAEAKPAPVAKEEKPKAEAKPAPAAKEEKPKAEAKPAPAAKEEKPKAEAKPAPAAKEEKPAAEAKPAPAAKEEKPKAEAKPAAAAKPSGKGKLACSSKPSDAEIWVDGKNTGKKTPLAPSSALELPSGKHTVIFKLGGKASAPQEVTVEPDAQVVLRGVAIP